jgi:Tfp pilus assembly protein PilF
MIRLLPLVLLLCCLNCATLHAQNAQAATTSAAAPAATPPAPAAKPVDPSSQAMAKAIGLMNSKNDIDGALDQLTQAIKLNPKNSAAYVLRASLYCQKKLYPQAEADFKSALALDPNNIVLKLNLPEIKFLQKQYDAARPGYIPLEKDPDMGDFASYEVFLCDLASGHEAVAQKELDAFNKASENPSYYYSNAAWSIAHKNYTDASSWLNSAGNIYPTRENAYYAESLIYVGYLPLPAPPQASNSP